MHSPYGKKCGGADAGYLDGPLVMQGVIILNVKNNEQENSDCYRKFVHAYRVFRNNA